MPFFLVAPLEASSADLERIESIRRAHDPQHDLVPAHVTLVFGFEPGDAEVDENEEVAEIAAHAGRVAAAHPPIAMRLSAFVAVRDLDDRRSHVFLVPDEGRVAIEALHAALYAGPLATHLRADIPFVPHVTVAARGLHADAEHLARSFGSVSIAAELRVVAWLSLERGVITTVKRFELGRPR